MLKSVCKFLYSLFHYTPVGLILLIVSILGYGGIFIGASGVTDRSQLDWDQGYLEKIEWSERKGKNFLVVYSTVYDKKRRFSSHSLLNTRSLKNRMIKDSYYERKVKIGSDILWLNNLAEGPTVGMSTYEVEYNGDVVLRFEDSSQMRIERLGELQFIVLIILLIINIPYICYLLLLLGIKRYGKP